MTPPQIHQPDICSRVTFVNFTVTKSCLQTRCLNQGEFLLRMRQLEKNLLSCLNEAKGRIFFQMGREFTIKMDLDHPSWTVRDYFPLVCPGISLPPNDRDAVVNAVFFVHQSLDKCNAKIVQRGGRVMPITPRHFLDFSQHKKQHLVKVRSMGNPEVIIRMPPESICVLLGENVSDWKSIRGKTMKDNSIPSIVNFNTDDISNETRKLMQERYLSNPEKVNRASLACGPLVNWYIAQLGYAEMLNRVAPLRQELKSLKDAAVIKKNKAERMTALISQLEAFIAKYKDEYAQVISQAGSIKSTLKTVQDKVNRSMGLLPSLGKEKDRWQHTSENFKFQRQT